jgi:hypothetical protein
MQKHLIIKRAQKMLLGLHSAGRSWRNVSHALFGHGNKSLDLSQAAKTGRFNNEILAALGFIKSEEICKQ